MIAQVVFVCLLVIVLGYAASQRRRSKPIAYTIVIAALGGILLVAFPSMSTEIANTLGIGRGADLVMYLFVLIAGFSITNLHLRMRSHDEQTTALAKALALQNPRPPK